MRAWWAENAENREPHPGRTLPASASTSTRIRPLFAAYVDTYMAETAWPST